MNILIGLIYSKIDNSRCYWEVVNEKKENIGKGVEIVSKKNRILILYLAIRHIVTTLVYLGK